MCMCVYVQGVQPVWPWLLREKNSVAGILTYWCLESCEAVIAVTGKQTPPQNGPSQS